MSAPSPRRRFSCLFPLLFGILVSGGIGCISEPKTPVTVESKDPLGGAFSKVHELEQSADTQAAIREYLVLVEKGLDAGEDGLRAVLVGLDALVWRTTPGLGKLGNNHALAFREPGAIREISERLAPLHTHANGHPIARGMIAQALLDLSKIQGNSADAARWRTASGAVQRATLVGPLHANPLSALTTLSSPEEGALLEKYPGVGPFASSLHPLQIDAEDGVLDAAAASIQPGLYTLLFDIEVPRAQRLWFSLQSTAGVILAAGGKTILQRPYALGGGAVTRWGWVDSNPGTLRLALRLAANEDGSRIVLTVQDDSGAPLLVQAVKIGSTASATIREAGALEIAPKRGESLELNAAALLALGESRAARRMLEEGAPTPGALLLYARALHRSDDTPENRRIERARFTYEKVSEAWPTSWEAQIGALQFAAVRRGVGEGSIETLRNLARYRAEGRSLPLLVQAFEAVTAADIGVRDVALKALEDLKKPLKDTVVFATIEDRVLPRIGAEAEARACTAPGRSRDSAACLLIKQQRGDFTGALAEIDRLRELRGSPRALLSTELALRLAQGDAAGVTRLYDVMYPGDRRLAMLGILPEESEKKSRLERDRATARDTPGQLPALRRFLGEDPVPDLEEAGRKAVEQDRSDTTANTSATLVLLHTERYSIALDGLLRAVLHDVRKVSGTTDVEQGVGGVSFALVGRDLKKLLRRRIHKRDGRILEPDAAAMASQGNSDLSQLEPGDYIEQISETWVLPDRAGHIVIDTEDLLPERTGVRHASIEVQYPKNIKIARWSHRILGQPEEREEGGRRIIRYHLDNASPRRMEEGTPRMDRDVAISFGTYSWADVGHRLGELVSALSEEDPFVTRWAHQAAGDATGREALDRIVAASGKSIRTPQANLLSDTSAALYAGPQAYSARHILELGQGSRSWVIYRALQALGIPAEIVVAEREPFSADPDFPARPSRFDHPLVIARLPEGEVWVDADLPGPPLLAGRVSPELRGRLALRVSGEQIPVQGTNAEQAQDEVDISLKLDPKGNATGNFSIRLRGRAAQVIVDALDRVAGLDRSEILRGVVLAWLPWATVNEVKLISAEGTGTLALAAEVVVPSLAQGEGQGWMLPGLEPLHSVLPRPQVSTLSAAYASQLGRQTALAIDTAVQFRVHRRIELPPGWKAPVSIPTLQAKHELFKASRRGKMNGNVLEEEFQFSLDTGTVTAEKYADFAAQSKRVDDGFLASIRLAP